MKLQGRKKQVTLHIDYKPHKTQRIAHRSKARFRCICSGRKWGKTTFAVAEAFHQLGKPGSIVWWVAPFQSVADIGWRRFLAFCPPLVIKAVHTKKNYIELVNGSSIFFKTADNPDALHGEGIDLLIVDEAARVREKVWYETLRPNLDDPKHFGRAILISTPRGHNWFYDCWLQGIHRRNNWEAWFYPLKNLEGGWPSWINPHFPGQALKDALALKERHEAVFWQEYGARFQADLGAVFKGILEARQGDLEPPREGVEYFAGVDFGFSRGHSYTVVAILDERGHLVAYDRFRGLGYKMTVERVASLLKEYKATALVDSTGFGNPIFEMLYERYDRIYPMRIKGHNKGPLIDNLALMIEQGRVTYPDIPELIEELHVFGMEQKGGKIEYKAPKGFTDDFVIALALAAWQLRDVSSEPPGLFFLPTEVV